jgi:hypothetical protein
MRRILLLLTILLLAAPVFGGRRPKHHPHPAVRHAKNRQYAKKRLKNTNFQQTRVRKQRHRLAENHPKNPNLPKQRKPNRNRKKH